MANGFMLEQAYGDKKDRIFHVETCVATGYGNVFFVETQEGITWHIAPSVGDAGQGAAEYWREMQGDTK